MSVSKPPSAAILKMSDRDTIRFVELYESEPVLWNPKDPKYTKKDARDAAAERVAAKLNIDNFTARYVPVKFKNLRSSYSQEVKKIKESVKAGCSTDEVYVPKVVWFPIMDRFLQPHVKSRNPHTNFYHTQKQDIQNQDSQDIQVNEEIETQYNYDGHTKAIQDPCLEIDSDVQPPTRKIDGPFRSESMENKPSTSFKRKAQTINISKKRRVSPYIKSALQELDDILRRACSSSANREDHLDYFGKYIVAMLRNVPASKSFGLQQHIISLVMEAQMSEEISTTEHATSEVFADNMPPQMDVATESFLGQHGDTIKQDLDW